jgi:TP901 family phage tail tape measure protein
MAARKAEVIITCDGAAAKQVLEGINRELQKAIKEREQLLQKQKQNGTLTQDEIKRDRELKKYIDSLTTAQQKSAQEMRKYADVMKDLAGSKTKDLKKALGEVKRALDNMSAKDPKRQQLVADLKRIQAQIDANTGAIKKQKSAWGSLGTTMKNLFAYAGVFAGFNKLKSMVEGVFKANLKLSDSLADIRKVSGLTMGEINQLYRNIAKIDTRNTVETLNQLAYTGAKLGIGQYGVSGLTGFVKAAEQVQMALGEDLGQEALPALAKLTEVMGIINNYGVEQAMQKTASAIFQLGATSTATGKNIIEFSKRLMGLANVSNVSADELLALGSAADAMGLMPEVAATAFNKLFTSLQKNHNLIEKSLGIDPGTIDSLYQQGKTMEAMVTIFERMKETGNMNALGGVFKDLGSDGARLVNVMATMADRVDILKKHLKTSTDAFKEGEAVIAEYMIQNETAAAIMERASNIWIKAFTNPEGVDMVKNMADEWYPLSKQMTENQTVMYSLRTAIEGIALAIETLIKLLPFLLHMLTFMGVLATVRSLYFGFTSLVTAIRTATTAQMAFNAAAKSNIVLALVSAVASLAAIWYESARAAEEAAEREAERQAELQQAYQASKAAIEDSVRPLRTFKKVMDEANLSEREKMQLVKDFKGDYQDYLDYLGIEVNTVDELASAYADVVKVMKQKRAYEERENYRENVNGSNKMSRIAAGAEVERELRKMGAEGVDKNWILSQRDNSGLGTKDLYNQIMRQTYGSGAVEIKGVGKGRWQAPDSKGKMREVTNQALWRAINEYLTSHDAEKALNQTVDEMFKDDVGNFDLDKWNEERMKSRLKRRGGLSNLKPDKEEEKALKKEQAEAKKAMRKEMEDAQKESTAVINAIEEFYRLQEAAAEQMVADGKLTRSEADKMIEYLRNRKDEMLLEARRAITGNKNNFESLRQTMGKDVLRPGDEATDRAKETVQTVDVKKAADNLKKYDGGNNVFGLNSGSFTQSVLKNAAQNELNITRRQAKVQEEIDKILRQYQYVEEAQKSFGDDLVKLGIVTSGYEKVVQQLSDGTEVTANTRDVQALANKVTGIGTRLFNVDTSDAEELRNMVDAIMTTVDKDGNKMRESFASMFPKLDEWMAEPEKFKTEMQAFYKTLLDYDTDYYKAIKQSREQMRKDFDERWETSGAGQAYTDVGRAVDREGRRQKMTGADQGTNFAQQAGFATIGNDPEVQASLLRMAQMQQELDMFKEVNAQKMLEGEALLAYQQELREKQQAMEDAELAMQETLMSKINDHIQRLAQWTEPIQQFATDVGDAMGQAIVSGESMSEAMQNALKSLVQSWGQSTIQIVKELMMQQLKQKLIGKTMVKQEKQTQESLSQSDEEGGEKRLKATNIVETGMASVMQTMGQQILAQKQTQDQAEMSSEATKTTGTVMAGIAQGAAKIIGTLGPWGAPLIAVITALLMGLLSAALGALFGGGSGDKGGDTSTKKKVKLASGMLTYDSGNVQETVGQQWRGKHGEYITDTRQTVIGDDGRVYRARRQAQLPSGVKMITEPIATTVNGQQALVAERGPEIVIGRKTTRAIQMNRPDLLRDLMMFDRGMTTRKARTFDEGNLSDLASAIMPTTDQPAPTSGGDPSSERQALIERLDRSDQLMQQVIYYLQNPVAPNINMYGENGLHKKIKQADKFLKQYGG